MYKKRNFIKHHTFHCLNKKEKICIAGIICCNFMRGVMLGLYLGEK